MLLVYNHLYAAEFVIFTEGTSRGGRYRTPGLEFRVVLQGFRNKGLRLQEVQLPGVVWAPFECFRDA